MNRLGVVMLCAAVLGGCGGSDSKSMPATCTPGQTTTQACECTDGAAGYETVDACTGDMVSACDCGEKRACSLPSGCAATQTCSADGCEPCQCTPPELLSTLSADTGSVVDLAGDGKGGLVLLLNSAPWLATAGSDGVIHPLSVHSSLSWAHHVWAAPNDTIVVLSAASGTTVQFQRFDLDGTLIGSGDWALPNKPTSLAAVAADGAHLAIIAKSADELDLLTLGADDMISPVAALPFTTEDGAGCCNSAPETFAISPTAQLFLMGSLTQADRIDGLWRASLDQSGDPLVSRNDKSFDLFPSAPRLAVSKAGTFASWTWSNHSYVTRFDDDLRSIWTSTSTDGKSLSSANDIVALPDGALMVGLQANQPAALRFDKAGTVTPLPLAFDGEPARVVAMSDYDLAIETEHSPGFEIMRVRIAPLATEAQGLGGLCVADADCSSQHCCRQASAATGACGGENGCAFDGGCTADSDCESGTCLLPQGVCSQQCVASSDCSSNSYCVKPCVSGCKPLCLPDCLATGDAGCAALGNWTCGKTQNEEGVMVHVCGG